MKIIFAEAVNDELVEYINGINLCHARVLSEESNKYQIMDKLFTETTISYFLKMGEGLNALIKNEMPLIIVTDWSDPTEMVGLRLESGDRIEDYPNLVFLAFNTDWEDIKRSGIEAIFAHEYSHLWLNLLGYDHKLSKSNKFNTCTAITDVYLAFSEGLAEHLEIVTKELNENKVNENGFWDYGYDVNAWISLRDEQLRYHAAINNRFIYHTAFPYFEDYETYSALNLAHITSSAFTPEKLKNGSQMMASEGAISTIFYLMYKSEVLKNTYLDNVFYHQFGKDKEDVDVLTNLYLKIIFAISKIDLTKSSLMTDFIEKYGEAFPNEKKELYDIFLRATHYSTVSADIARDFGKFYRIGRSGEVNAFREAYKNITMSKEKLFNEVLNGDIKLNQSLYAELWIEADEEITPVPWVPEEKTKYRFDINTATEIDLLSISGISIERAKQIIKTRELQGGFKSLEEFYEMKKMALNF